MNQQTPLILCSDQRQGHVVWQEHEPLPDAAVLPGAFNPLHDGHRRMAAAAAELAGRDVVFELAVANVDKGLLREAEVRRRAAQFRGQRLFVSTAATFLEKSRLFPRAIFVVGADTMLRIGQRVYYASEAGRRQAVEELSNRGCRFLVCGRRIEGQFKTLNDLPLPAPLRSLCREVPPDRFRSDLSSSQIRGDLPDRGP